MLASLRFSTGGGIDVADSICLTILTIAEAILPRILLVPIDFAEQV